MTMSEEPTAGIQIDLFNGSRLENAGTAEKVRTILNSVKAGNVVVLGGGLTPEEEGQLIETTMSQIQPDGFTGVEIETYHNEESSNSGLFGRVLGKSKTQTPPKLTVVGPANQMKTLHKDEQLLSTLVRPE